MQFYPITRNTWGINMDHPNKNTLEYFFTTSFTDTVKENRLDDIVYRQKVENLIIGFALYELRFTGNQTNLIKNFLEYLQTSNVFPNLKNIYTLYHSATIDDINSSYNLQLIKCNYLLLRSSFTNIQTKTNSSNGKALFLLGDPIRHNRFPILYEFYLNNDLNLLDYSYDCTYPYYESYDNFFNRNENFIKLYSDCFNIEKIKIKEHILMLQNKLPEDDFFKLFTKIGAFAASAYVYPKIWHEFSVIIAAETSFDDVWQNNYLNFTEKMYKPILTKKPFITCSEQDYIYRILESHGFKTFLEYTDFSNKIEDCFTGKNLRQYSQLTYNRTKSLLQNMKKYETEIENDVKHNFMLWEKLCENAWTELFEKCPILNTVSKENITRLFLMGAPHAYVEENINNILYSFLEKLKAKQKAKN